MQIRRTEAMHDAAAGLDARPPAEIAAILLDGQMAALDAVRGALPALAEASGRIARCLSGAGRVHYAGAGSSGLMAGADAMELAGTFGIDPARALIHMAGGLPQDATMPGGTEDDAGAGASAAGAVSAGDAAIVVAASGSTPYALGFAEAARARGAATICIANVPGAPLFAHADVAVCLPTPPEVLAGSTRMGAGTAQKAALNILSTLVGVALGHVHDGMMVNLRADNAKLRARAAGIVARIAGVGPEAAASALDEAGGEVKPAVMIALGVELPAALRVLEQTGGNLRAALGRVKSPA
ncbi:N-acetylmuramic acid 6-phosphate etherase [Palleronia sp. KMU-117]|uniref:N-acetylmuramic acid 6-phosphate etherase n=1 Tax=Palleronia sp. KMU-117 TaxID=3434108 RepID=UPI003D736FBA